MPMEYNFEQSKGKASYELLHLTQRLEKLNRKIRRYGTDTLLHEAEIHTIKAIHENSEIHITGLAQKLGVTKGAISQIVAKLEKKGMVQKLTDPKNQSRTLLALTKKGEIAYAEHERMHAEFDRLVEQVLSSHSEENIKFLHLFMKQLEQKLDTFDLWYQKTLPHHGSEESPKQP